jgi:hypothetical protein
MGPEHDVIGTQWTEACYAGAYCVVDMNRQVEVRACRHYAKAVIMRDRAGDTVARYPSVDTNVNRAPRPIEYRFCLVIRRFYLQTLARRLAILTDCEEAFLRTSKQTSAWYLELGHNRFPLHPFQFLIHQLGQPHASCVKTSIKTWDKRHILASFVIQTRVRTPK